VNSHTAGAVGASDFMLDTALAYAARGFNVIPIRPDDRKRPWLAAWKPYQEQRVNDEELQRWFSRPGTGVAAICGRVSGGLVVVDVDDPALGERFLASSSALLQSTPCARSGGGNLHVYVRAPLPPRKFSLLNCTPSVPIDVQAEGSYIVMPPSLHASGRRYEWLPGCGSELRLVQEFNLWFQSALARAGIDWMPTARSAPGPSFPPNHDLASTIIGLLRDLAGVDGERRGTEVWFNCPFHADWIPSLSASTERPVWYCLGCGQGGGIKRLRELQRGR
jgi:hypothetical protein